MGNMGFVLLSGDLRSVSNTLRGVVVGQTAVEVVMATYRIVDLTFKPWEH